MPAGGRREPLLVDTSVAVAIAVAGHEHHESAVAAVGRARLGLAGHAAFETLSVLTRLPAPLRREPRVVARLLERTFPSTRHLSLDAAASLLPELGALDIAGGSVYDALIGACAREHGLRLLTRDRRALDVYRALDVDVEALD